MTLVSGSGGAGCISFHKTRKIARGGPDGGHGGDGGDIILKSTTQVQNLDLIKKTKILKASSGQPGKSQLKAGQRGQDKQLSVPVGTLVRDATQQPLKDFAFPQQVVFLKGGQGGKGNAFFKSSLNQAPQKSQKGQKGKTQKVILEFKPLVDVGVIGEVNSGKSTFFNQVTRAKSPVSFYPYTTLKPHVGQIKKTKEKTFLMDIPGLAQGAHEKESKGLPFLRSLQRVKLLLHFISSDQENPEASQTKIEKELYQFDQKNKDHLFQPLSEKKKFTVITQTDKTDNTHLNKITKQLQKKNQSLFLISCHQNQGIKELLIAIEKEIKN